MSRRSAARLATRGRSPPSGLLGGLLVGRRLRGRRPSRRRSAAPSPTASAAPAPAAPAVVGRHRRQLPEVLRPDGTLPAPRDMPAGSYMDKIQQRGRLIAGVSADTLLLGARNPISGQIEGFDIDMLHAVSQAIFGDPNRIELRVVTAAQRLPVLQDGSVDIVARNMTITCARWKDIAFSSEYYRSGQKVLVRSGEKTEQRWPRSPA